jgi:hypothetical protein
MIACTLHIPAVVSAPRSRPCARSRRGQLPCFLLNRPCREFTHDPVGSVPRRIGKRDKKVASFVTIGEPDIELKVGRVKDNAPYPQTATVQIKGLDIYDPIKDEVKGRDVHDIAYWMVDTDYDGANFISRLYDHQSHPFKIRDGQRIAVRVISQFGAETTKVLSVQP